MIKNWDDGNNDIFNFSPEFKEGRVDRIAPPFSNLVSSNIDINLSVTPSVAIPMMIVLEILLYTVPSS